MKAMTLVGVLLLGWIGTAFAQMGPMESKVRNGLPGEDALIEIRVKIFEMTREQMQAFVAKYKANPGSIPVSSFEQALKESAAGIMGTIDESTASALWKAVDAAPGVDLVVSPTMTAASGKTAHLRLGRSFRYPTSREPKKGAPGGYEVSDFETRPLGVTIDVAPKLGADGKTIDLGLKYEFGSVVGYRKFDGGSEVAVNGDTNYEAMNRVAQPLFDVRRADMKQFLTVGQTLWVRTSCGLSTPKTLKVPEFEFILVSASLVKAK